jgi:hypothetical protein
MSYLCHPCFDCLTNIDEEKKVLSSFLLSNFIHPDVTSALSGQTIFLSTLFSNTLKPFFFILNIICTLHQSPYKTC